jgi:ADP-ribose pyrophosphatase YjhB (NUDIX family)
LALDKFNVRVYAIIQQNDRYLLADEVIGPHEFTKFPGGGVELGEGLEEAIMREVKEELNCEIASLEHLYTTDFFVKSAFRNNEQLISVYYNVEINGIVRQDVLDESTAEKKHLLSFRWVKKEDLYPEVMSFPVDQFVVKRFIAPV